MFARCHFLTAPLGITSAAGLALSMASYGAAIQESGAGMNISIIPAVSLVAIIGGAISMGMLFNRVKQLEQQRTRDERDEDGRRQAIAKETEMIRQRIHDLNTTVTVLNIAVENLTAGRGRQK